MIQMRTGLSPEASFAQAAALTFWRSAIHDTGREEIAIENRTIFRFRHPPNPCVDAA